MELSRSRIPSSRALQLPALNLTGFAYLNTLEALFAGCLKFLRNVPALVSFLHDLPLLFRGFVYAWSCTLTAGCRCCRPPTTSKRTQ